MLAEHGFQVEQIAVVLRVREPEIQRLTVSVATAPAGSANAIPGTNAVPLKISARHLAGTIVTAAQATAIASMPGTSYSLIVKQVLDGLRRDLMDPHNTRLHELLVALRAELDRYLERH